MLIESTLYSMPSYYLSLSKLPTKVAQTVDKKRIIRDFFWEGSRGDGGMHNIDGEKTQLP